MAINLTPDSEGRPDCGEAADGLLQKSRLRYNREDREAAERERTERVTGPLSSRRTREAASGVTAYAKEPRFQQAVERVQQQIRSGRVTLASVRAENTADEQRLAGWAAVSPRRGTAGYERFMALKTRVAIRALALQNEIGLMPGAAPLGVQTEMREIGWTDAARAAALLARRARAIGRKAAKLVTRRPYSQAAISRTAKRLAAIRTLQKSGRAHYGANIHGVPMSWKPRRGTATLSDAFEDTVSSIAGAFR